MKISVLYYSGTGGTKVVAELLAEVLGGPSRLPAPRHEVATASIYDSQAAALSNADLLVLCYPTYFLRPAPSMREFIERLGPFDRPKPAYVVTTVELYSENSIRSCASMLKDRGVAVVGSKVIRAPGSDVTCVLPSVLLPWLYRFEKSFPRKIGAMAQEILALADEFAPRMHGPSRRDQFPIPPPKWYTPFAQALQLLFLNDFAEWRDKFRVLPERCTSCGACAASCDRDAWDFSGGGPSHIPERCELCTRCIHRCPEKAIVLIERLKDNRRLDTRLYASLKADARKAIGAEAKA